MAAVPGSWGGAGEAGNPSRTLRLLRFGKLNLRITQMSNAQGVAKGVRGGARREKRGARRGESRKEVNPFRRM